MRITKQDRIDQLESWLRQKDEELSKCRANREMQHEFYRDIRAKDRQLQDTLKAALGDIINRVDKAILRRRSTDTERAIKGVAKQALEKTK